MSISGAKVLVTGAGGFIGSHLCEELLKEGVELTGLIRYTSRSDWGNLEFCSPESKSKMKIVAGNIEDSDFVSNQVAGQDIVFHLAALIGIPYSYVAPLSYVRTNVEGTLNVMEASKKYGVKKVIHTSTSEVYGTALYTPMDEKHSLQGQSPYSASKIGADKIAESYFRSFGLPVTTIRPFNTYGPRQSARAVIPTVISQALNNKEIRLGTLEPIRDLNFVKDTANGFIQAAKSDSISGETINIGFGKGISIKDLATKILSLMNCDKQIVSDDSRVRPPNSEVDRLICDFSKATKLIGWKPAHTLKQGLLETIDFVTKNQGLFKPNNYVV